MIKPEELRIGNIVSHSNGNGNFDLTVNQILSKGINVVYNDAEWFIYYEEINPIPLTEEWLVKFGMIKYKDHIPYSYVFNIDKKLGFNRFRLQYAHYGDGSEGFYCLFLHKVQSAKIEYVHQLQNLIYAVGGKELEYDK